MPAAHAAKPPARTARHKATTRPLPESPLSLPLAVGRREPVIQRKACACGGSCPRCRDEIKPLLRVGPVDDPYEREADRLAMHVLDLHGSTPHPAPPSGDRPADTGPEPSEGTLTTGGDSLPISLREFFESRLGRDLSQVRVHTGPQAEATTDRFDAHAFTLGHHIWFGRGQAPRRDFVLAHELVHVVQQQHPAPTLRRLGRAPFWIPLGAAGAMTGTDIHAQLLDESVGKNKELDNEAPAPNADLNGWGLGHQGKIDLYRGKKGTHLHVMPGVTFGNAQNIPVGSQCNDPLAALPRAHFQARTKDAKGTIAPRMEGSRIVDIAKGPETVHVGELKPAAAEILAKGEGQLTNYREGMAHAARLTNAWAVATTATNKVAPEWKLSTPGVLEDSAVQFKPEHEFNPASPRGDVNLVLGKVGEASGTFGQKYPVSIEFNPAAKGLPPVKGGLYAMKSNKPGLWMYFARPQKLDEALNKARGNIDTQGNMVLANRVQDEVVVPLLKPPEKVVTKLPVRRPQARPLHEAQRIRRKQRTSPKLKDDFDVKKWKKSQEDLRGEARTQADPGKTKLAALDFLHEAYRAEEALDAVPGTGKTSLPPKSKDMVKAGSDPKTARSHPLADLGPWLQGWTGRPAGMLGTLRHTFGDVFVFAANKFIEIRDAIRKKVKGFLERRNKSLGTGMGDMILRAIGRGLKAVLQVALHQTAHYIVNKVLAGLKRKLAKWFDFDPRQMLEDKLEEVFGSYLKPLVDLKNKVQGFFDDTVKSITDRFSWIEDLKALADKVRPVIEAGVAALQCLTPPGWGCLKMLLRKLQNWAIEQVLQMCDVKALIAQIVGKVPFLGNLAKFLGDTALGLMKSVVPKDFKDVFEVDEPVPEPDKVECDDDWDPEEPPPSPAPQRNLKQHLETLQELNELRQEQGDEKAQALSEMIGAAGIPDEHVLTADDVKALRAKLRETKATAQDMKAFAEGQAGDEVRQRLKPMTDYLDGVAGPARKELMDQVAKDLKAGKYDPQFRQMAASKRTWLFLRTPMLGMPFTGARVLMVNGSLHAAGLVDGGLGVCDARGEVEVTIVRADLRDAANADQAVQINLPVRGPMEGMCGKPPAAGGRKLPAPGQETGGPQARAPAGGTQGGAQAPEAGGGTAAAGGGVGGQGPRGRAPQKGQPAPKGTVTVGDVIREGPAGGDPTLAAPFAGYLDFCAQVLQCPASATQVTFEAEDEKALGLRAVLASLAATGGSAGSLQRARNPNGPLELKDKGDGTFEIRMLDMDGKPHFVGTATKSQDKAGEFEVKSGPILQQLRTAAKKWEKRYDIPSSESRAHRFRI